MHHLRPGEGGAGAVEDPPEAGPGPPVARLELAGGDLQCPGGAEPAPGDGDEQPIDACALVEAELAAFAVTGDPDHGTRAQTSFNWFLGRNRLGVPLYDFATGGCSDGLGETAANRNEGAESTLAFHRAKLVLEAAQLPIVARRPVMAAA